MEQSGLESIQQKAAKGTGFAGELLQAEKWHKEVPAEGTVRSDRKERERGELEKSSDNNRSYTASSLHAVSTRTDHSGFYLRSPPVVLGADGVVDHRQHHLLQRIRAAAIH